MILTGTIVNALGILAGGGVGLLIHKLLHRGIPQRFSDAIIKAIALAVIYIAFGGILDGSHALVTIFSLVTGAVIGEWIDIDGRIQTLSTKLERRFAKGGDNTFSQGFMTATLLFCVGTMAIKGSLDSGLINYSLGIQAMYFLDIKLSDVYRGTLAEQMVWQELLSQSSRELNMPTFWVKEKKQSNAEVDFMISWQGHMLPAEVKSGKDGTLRSLHQFIDNGGEPFAIRLYDQQYSLLETQTPEKDGVPGRPYRLLNLPLYCAGKIPAYLELLYT